MCFLGALGVLRDAQVVHLRAPPVTRTLERLHWVLPGHLQLQNDCMAVRNVMVYMYI